MKKQYGVFLTVLFLALMIFCTSVTASAVTYDQVAGEDERASVQEIGVEGMQPISGTDIVDGTYEVTVESSSAMFRIEKATLTVAGGKMTADITLGGTGYSKLFMGTGVQAAKSEFSDYIGYVENDDGKYTFTVPVEALDQSINCASFSKRKEKWYDHAILFEAKSLPEKAVKVTLPDYDALEKAAQEKRIAQMQSQTESKAADAQDTVTNLPDGVYSVAVDLEGGTGRASITSPTELTVKDGKMTAKIQWSSSKYDYMKVDGEKYMPVRTEGNSEFEIPVTTVSGPMEVIADTTAMSTPHEVTYQLTFHTEALIEQNTNPSNIGILFLIIGIALVCFAAAVILCVVVRRKKK